MKKGFLFFLTLTVLVLISVYIFIPSKISISATVIINTIPKSIVNVLDNTESWKLWWPRHHESAGIKNYFTYKGYRYQIITRFADGAQIDISKNKKTYPTIVLAIPIGKDSAIVQWRTSLPASLNPIIRVVQFFEAKNIRNNIQDILQRLGTFAGKTENIYGFDIQRTTFTDTILLVTKFSTPEYPGTGRIYDAVNFLKQKIVAAGAVEKDYPMLNVNKTDNGYYQTMIAICIDRIIKTGDSSFISRMVPMKDRFLKTEVTGGPGTLIKAHEAIQNYMNDRILTSPAIPFEILITDRRRQSDTSKWKTIIFQPSM